MAKDYSNKIQFFSKQGYSNDLLNFVTEIDPGKHFNWFVEILKKFNTFDGDLKEKSLMILNMFQKREMNYPKTLEEAIIEAEKFKQFEDSYESRVLHTFEDGYHIYLLNYQELQTEGNVMSNCLGQYVNDVKNKRCSILSLRDKNRKSLTNIQVWPNGAIGQNFEKGNRQVKFSNWKYISEFFSIYGKDMSKVRGVDGSDKFTTLSLQMKGFSMPILSKGIPTSIRTFINENGEIKSVPETIQFIKNVEGTDIASISEFGEIDEIIKQLDQLQERITQSIDRLKSFALELQDKNIFLNDDIKKKIFGEEYFLKGDINISDVISSYSQKKTRRAPEDRLRAAIINLAGAVHRGGDLEENVEAAEAPLAEARAVINEDTFGHPDEEVNNRINHLIRNGMAENLGEEMNEFDYENEAIREEEPIMEEERPQHNIIFAEGAIIQGRNLLLIDEFEINDEEQTNDEEQINEE